MADPTEPRAALPTADAALTDAGLTDAALTDAALTDAGLTDAGPADAGLTDAGPADATPDRTPERTPERTADPTPDRGLTRRTERPDRIRVELFEDRAGVTRTVAVPAAGRHRLRIGPVSPLVSDRAVTFPGGARATLEEVRIERVRLTRTAADPESIARLEADWRIASRRVDAATVHHQRAVERVSRADRAVDAGVAAAPRAMVEQDRPERWIDAVAALASQAREARAIEVRERCAVRRRRDEVARLAGALALARAGRPVVVAWIHLSVWAEEPGELLVRYVVPCAAWRPAHRATLSSSGDASGADDRLGWELGAVCWNATGEDWTDADLTCSTARPGDLAEPPQLDDDAVVTRKRDREVVVEARDVAIAAAREVGGPARPAELPGVDDGGEPRTWRADGPVTIPSDGRPVTIRLDAWEGPAESRWVALPELAGAAVLRTTQRNGGTRPLLAGPVELVRDGVSIGRGAIPLVAPGEVFPLGFGSHDGLRISRRQTHEVDRTLLTGHQRHLFAVEVRVVHLGAEPVRVEVRERIPTSELKEVTVGAPTADPALDLPVDRDGFCRWTLALAPGEVRVVTLRWTIDAPSHVTLPF
ncbi:MAG: DUF4139 domain-containing protein [Myxococcota bacterium]